MKTKTCLALLLLPVLAFAAEPRAKNVILFLGDAGGIPTLNAAGLRAHDKPQSLYLHSFPHLALSDTSSLDRWVTDSAAGMTAIVTGEKTNNGMLSLLPAVNGQPARTLKTILEYAEERGLSTGVVTNMPVWGRHPRRLLRPCDLAQEHGGNLQAGAEPRASATAWTSSSA
jgi:alkaline phosphatase